MDDSTKTMMLTLASGIIKKGLITLGATAATHGIIASNQTETFVAAGMFLVGAGWSFWNDYGKAIVLSRLEVLKAQSLAQAAKLRSAGIKQPTVSEIAAQHPTLTTADVTKAADIVVKVLVAAVLLSAFLFADPAMAQTGLRRQVFVDPLQKLIEDISAKKAEFVTNVVAAIQEADEDAATLTNPGDPTSFRDPISHACYPAQIKFLQSLPQVQVINAKAPYNLIVLFQRKRDLVAQIKAGLPVYLKLGCSALIGDEKAIFLQTLSMVGVTVGAGALTGLFPAAAPFTLPALGL